MGRLLNYELKKILKRPFTMVVGFGCLAVLLFAGLFVPMQENFAYAWGPDVYGSYEAVPEAERKAALNDGLNGQYEGALMYRGMKAIEIRRQNEAFLEGEWDNARLQKLAADYQAFINNPEIYTDELDSMSMQVRSWDLTNGGMSQAEVDAYAAANPIYTKKPEVEFGEWQKWQGLSYFIENELIAPDGRVRSFEEVYPLVQAPAQYEYNRGPRMAADLQGSLVGGLVLAMLLAGLAPLFSEEVSCHTEPMLLAAKYGRGKLIYAKLAAGLLFAVGGLVLFSLLNVLLSGIIYGFSGWGVPIQLVAGLTDMPYALNGWQFLLMKLGLQALGLCATAGILMLLSAVLRSALPGLFATGLFSVFCLILASKGSEGIRQLAQALPPGMVMPETLLYEGADPGLTFLPIPQLHTAILVSAVILVATLTAILLKYRKLQKS